MREVIDIARALVREGVTGGVVWLINHFKYVGSSVAICRPPGCVRVYHVLRCLVCAALHCTFKPIIIPHSLTTTICDPFFDLA